MAAQNTNHVRNVEPSHPPFGGIELKKWPRVAFSSNRSLYVKRSSADVSQNTKLNKIKRVEEEEGQKRSNIHKTVVEKWIERLHSNVHLKDQPSKDPQHRSFLRAEVSRKRLYARGREETLRAQRATR